MMFLRILTLATLVLAGCGEHASDLRCAKLPRGGEYCLQSTAVLAPFNAQQKVDIRVRERRETLIAQIESDTSGIRFAGLTPMGQTLLKASYDNLAVSATQLPDKHMNLELVFALLQVALWPPEAVRAGLDASLTLDEERNERRVVHRGEVVLRITYQGDQRPFSQMHLTIPAMDVVVDIETLPESTKE